MDAPIPEPSTGRDVVSGGMPGSQSVVRFGSLANVSAIGSLTMCFGKVAIAGVLGLLGMGALPSMGDEGPSILPHVQAVLMWGFALLVIIGVARDRRQYRRSLPLYAAIAGFAIMVGTLYLFYDQLILFLAYVLIMLAAFLNQINILQQLYGTVSSQAQKLAEWSQTLENRVETQVGEIDRLGRLKRFLSPQVAELITKSGDDSILSSHRGYITVLFGDLRGFTAFSTQMEPEEAMEVLQKYHEEMGKLVAEYNGTISHRAGDGLMVIFNDPVPCDDPVMHTIRLAIEMRDTANGLAADWRKRQYQLGFGVGIAAGYATLGVVGFEGRYDYTANGNVVNLASRLCDSAENGQIIIDQRAYADIEGRVEVVPLADLTLKGFDKPIQCFNLIGLREPERRGGE